MVGQRSRKIKDDFLKFRLQLLRDRHIFYVLEVQDNRSIFTYLNLRGNVMARSRENWNTAQSGISPSDSKRADYQRAAEFIPAALGDANLGIHASILRRWLLFVERGVPVLLFKRSASLFITSLKAQHRSSVYRSKFSSLGGSPHPIYAHNLCTFLNSSIPAAHSPGAALLFACSTVTSLGEAAARTEYNHGLWRRGNQRWIRQLYRKRILQHHGLRGFHG